MVDTINTNANSLSGTRAAQKPTTSLGGTKKGTETTATATDTATTVSLSQTVKSQIASLNTDKAALNANIASTDLALAEGSVSANIEDRSQQLAQEKVLAETQPLAEQSDIQPLVSTTLSAASAFTQASQIKEALADQAFSIANQAPEEVLSLFSE